MAAKDKFHDVVRIALQKEQRNYSMTIAFYIDENVHRAIRDGLRIRE